MMGLLCTEYYRRQDGGHCDIFHGSRRTDSSFIKKKFIPFAFVVLRLDDTVSFWNRTASMSSVGYVASYDMMEVVVACVTIFPIIYLKALSQTILFLMAYY